MTANTHDGLMRACGHNVHKTTLPGIAAVPKQMAPRLAGSVKVGFQPAEEFLGGMQAMIVDELMGDSAIDMAPGFHNQPDRPAGRFGFVCGPAAVTVGATHGGATHNIILDSCLIKGTVRRLHTEVRDIAESAIKRLAEGLLAGVRVRREVDYRRDVPCLMNDDRILMPGVAAVRARR